MSIERNERSRVWVALPTAILAGVANVFLFFLFMVLYGYVIAPGHEDSYYQEAANRLGPYASIIGGMPVFFVAGLVLRRVVSDGDRPLRVAIAAWCIYAAIDAAILIAAGQFVNVLPHVVVSFATKLAAIYLGARPRTTNSEGEII